MSYSEPQYVEQDYWDDDYVIEFESVDISLSRYWARQWRREMEQG